MSDAAAELDAESPYTKDLKEQVVRLQRQLSRAKAKSEDLIDAVYQAAKDAAVLVGPARPVAELPVERRKSKPLAALLHATDWQVGKRTETYNPDIAAKRIALLSEKVATITDVQRQGSPVTHCFLALGGDMVEGVGIFPGQAYEVDQTLYEQLFHTARMVEDLIRSLLRTFRCVTVYDIHGNHGRLGRKGDFPGSDNIDRMLYRIVADRFADERRVTWIPTDGWYRIMPVGEYRALLVHGDQIKGFGGNIPAYGILRKANGWAAGAIAEPFTDVYLGHFHQNITMTMSNGHRVFVTGSPESSNVFAQEFIAASSIPSQRLHFVDPRKGRVVGEYAIWLD